MVLNKDWMDEDNFSEMEKYRSKRACRRIMKGLVMARLIDSMKMKIGECVSRLRKEDRDSLMELKSEDVKKERW